MPQDKKTFNVNGKHLNLEQLVYATKRWLDARPILLELSSVQGHELPYRVPPLIEQAHELLTRDLKTNAIG